MALGNMLARPIMALCKMTSKKAYNYTYFNQRDYYYAK